MLSPFAPIVPRSLEVSYDDLARAAKTYRVDPGGYRPVAGIEYRHGVEALYRWEIHPAGSSPLVGLLGIFPLDRLVPHESTTAAALTRPRHAVQIRPVMGLVDGRLPDMEAIGPPFRFVGSTTHTATPVAADTSALTSAVIADGHHRTFAARREGGDPWIMALLVGTEGATLDAGAFHRVFARPVSLPGAVSSLDHRIETAHEALDAGRLAVTSGEVTVGIRPTGPMAERHSGLPAGWVHDVLLPLLGLDERDAVYLDDLEAAEAAGQYGTSIALPSSDANAVVRAARAGVTLPPKATRFRPKPLRGFLMRRL